MIFQTNQSHMRDVWLPTAPAAPATERGFRGSAAPYIAPLCGPWTLCAPVGWWLEGGLGGGIQFEVDFADVSCAATKRQALRAVAQLPPRALRAPLVELHLQITRIGNPGGNAHLPAASAPAPPRPGPADIWRRLTGNAGICTALCVCPHAQRRCVGELARIVVG